jgi:hypothetical protein
MLKDFYADIAGAGRALVLSRWRGRCGADCDDLRMITSLGLRRGLAVILAGIMCAGLILLIFFLALTDDPFAGLQSMLAQLMPN